MLTILIPASKDFNEITSEFIQFDGQVLELEHSLVSLSKWESKWCKSFLHTKQMTYEETVDYIKCMTLTQNVSNEVYDHLTNNNVEEIIRYIQAPMTATYFAADKNSKGKRSREIVTAELIYYWMISLGIPFECQDWHLNRLLTLIKVCNMKSTPPKKMGKKDVANYYAELNAARRKKHNSKG